MKTLVVELLNDKAEELLHNLEAMNIIRINDDAEIGTKLKLKNMPVKLKPSDYFEILSKEEGEALLNHVNESRSEWESIKTAY